MKMSSSIGQLPEQIDDDKVHDNKIMLLEMIV